MPKFDDMPNGVWQPLTPQLGMLSSLIYPAEVSVKEQIEQNYAHGGGYVTTPGFTLELPNEGDTAQLLYPGDPPIAEISRCRIDEELVIVFDYAFVAIVQRGGAFEVARMD